VLEYIAGQLELKYYAAGSEIVLTDDSIPQVYFLLRGEIEQSGPDETKQIISTESELGVEPLQCPPDTVALRAISQVALLKFPEELYDNIHKLPPLELANKKQPARSMATEIKETDIFWKIYDSFKAGKLKLPSMPGIAMRISKVVKDMQTNSQDIARVIQVDPTVAGRIISVVNSPAYRGMSPIENLPDAVSRLGRNVTHNLVISFALSGLFYTDSAALKKIMRNCWKHASYVAAICHELGRVSPGLSADHALLCGLVHDIGVLPIIYAARDYPELDANPEKLAQIIDDLRGEIGMVVLREWGFPNDYIQAALHADDWMQDTGGGPNYTDLVIVAQLHAAIGTDEMQNLPRMDLVPAFHKLALGRLTPRHSLGILDNAKENIKELQTLLSGG
jgi:HD-like signal output (HDOD) protein